MYLLIFEDGSLQQSKKLPDDYDDSIDAGALEIIRFIDSKFEFRSEYAWHSVEETKQD